MQGNPLGRYTVFRDLGRGAIGRVYAVHDQATGAKAALKTLDRALHARLAQAFLKQAHSAGRLKHDHIVGIIDAGDAGETAYVAMELLEGQSLRALLDSGSLPVARAIRVASEVADALAYAHLEGVVHGGIKPSNIIVLRSGAVKVTDFGTAQLAGTAMLSGPQTGMQYMPPEQLRGHPIDHRSDVFALGAVLYEMLTRRPPFNGSSSDEILENVARGTPPPSEQNPHIPRALDQLVARMLAAKPEERVPGAPILVRELEQLREGLGLGDGAPAMVETARKPSVPLHDPAPSPPPPQRAPIPDPPREVMPASEATYARDERFMRHELERERASASRSAFIPSVPLHDTAPSPPPLQRAPIPDPPREAMPVSEAIYARDERFMRRELERERASASRAAFIAALALVLAILSIGVSALLYYAPDFIQRPIAATAQGPAAPAAPVPAAEAIKNPAPPDASAGESRSAAPVAPPESIAPLQPIAPPEPIAPAEPIAKAETAPPPPRASLPARKGAEPPLRGRARLTLAVTPQGELYIDGKHYGTTPPITTLDLEPGMHHIEVRSGSRRPYVTYMTVQPGEQRRIRHDFNAPPSRPPS